MLEFIWLYLSPIGDYQSYILWCMYHYYNNGIILKDKKIIYSLILFIDKYNENNYGQNLIFIYEFIDNIKDLYNLYYLIYSYYKKNEILFHNIINDIFFKHY